MFQLRVLRNFRDKYTNVYYTEGEIITVKNVERFRELVDYNKQNLKLVELVYAKKRYKKTTGPKIIIAQGYLYFIGGIETFLFNFCKYYKNRDITIVCKNCDNEQIIKLSEYANIIIDNGSRLECDVLIIGNYDKAEMYTNHIKSKKVYQMVHADLYELNKSVGILASGMWTKSGSVDKVISVSRSAHDGLKAVGGGESEIIYNILDKDYKDEDGLTFITLSRATKEKGIHRIIEMAQKMKEAGKHFMWFICCSLNQVKDANIIRALNSMPEFIIIPPGVYNKTLIKNCDYLVQLSDTESFCYSAYEALQRGVPVILTDFPEAFNMVKDGENGYILKKDLSNLDIDKIFNHKPTNIKYEDKCDYDKWEKVFKGEL